MYLISTLQGQVLAPLVLVDLALDLQIQKHPVDVPHGSLHHQGEVFQRDALNCNCNGNNGGGCSIVGWMGRWPPSSLVGVATAKHTTQVT